MVASSRLPLGMPSWRTFIPPTAPRAARASHRRAGSSPASASSTTLLQTVRSGADSRGLSTAGPVGAGPSVRPDALHVVRRKSVVGGEQRDALEPSLCDQDTV